VLVAHTYNPQEECGSRPVWANSLQDPILKTTRVKLDWRCGSSNTVPALQAQRPEFKSQSHQKKKKKKSNNIILAISIKQKSHVFM
jgi:hypothetical protein